MYMSAWVRNHRSAKETLFFHGTYMPYFLWHLPWFSHILSPLERDEKWLFPARLNGVNIYVNSIEELNQSYEKKHCVDCHENTKNEFKLLFQEVTYTMSKLNKKWLFNSLHRFSRKIQFAGEKYLFYSQMVLSPPVRRTVIFGLF